MLKKNMKQFFVWLYLFILLIPLNVFASNEDTELTIKYPLDNVQFSFYKVAEYSEYGCFNIVEPFTSYKDQIQSFELIENNSKDFRAKDWDYLADTLNAYVVEKNISPSFDKITNCDGIISLAGIDKGLYLLLCETVEKEEQVYTAAPVLISVPNIDKEGTWVNQVTVNYIGKVGIVPLYDSYKVTKIWVCDDNKIIPNEVVVELYKNDSKEVYSTVKLNENNNWEYEWTNLPKGCQWIVVEKVVPDYYKVSYQIDGNNFYIINTYSAPQTEIETDKKLPQTGQPWLPVIYLFIIGLTLIILGFKSRSHE